MHLRTARNDAPVPSHPVAPLSKEEYNRQRKAWKAHCKAIRVEQKSRKKRDKAIVQLRKDYQKSHQEEAQEKAVEARKANA